NTQPSKFYLQLLSKDKFMRKDALKERTFYHTDRNIFEFDICSYQFSDRRNIISHTKIKYIGTFSAM
ncbi:hypothetical protein FWK35_00006121, partial [Aphis craccivora]